MMAALITEVVMTAMFLIIILGATDKRGITSHGGLAIGLGLTLIHLISIPVTNTSVNPARSTGPALVCSSTASPRPWVRCGCSGSPPSSVPSSAPSSTASSLPAARTKSANLTRGAPMSTPSAPPPLSA